jgi:hypothetical protein
MVLVDTLVQPDALTLVSVIVPGKLLQLMLTLGWLFIAPVMEPAPPVMVHVAVSPLFKKVELFVMLSFVLVRQAVVLPSILLAGEFAITIGDEVPKRVFKLSLTVTTYVPFTEKLYTGSVSVEVTLTPVVVLVKVQIKELPHTFGKNL